MDSTSEEEEEELLDIDDPLHPLNPLVTTPRWSVALERDNYAVNHHPPMASYGGHAEHRLWRINQSDMR